jgi:signal transduction histidine kinase
MRRVADTGRSALSDMRRMLGVLHADDESREPGLQPQPGVAELGELIAQSRAAGLPVTLTTTGIPPTAPAEQLTVFRVVQESLTNALRHAGAPRSVLVTVVHRPEATTVSVADDGSGSTEPHEPGHGLVGMRERVALYGGTVDAGPRPGGGWLVSATIPRGAGG